jgi:hypothetical protein
VISVAQETRRYRCRLSHDSSWWSSHHRLAGGQGSQWKSREAVWRPLTVRPFRHRPRRPSSGRRCSRRSPCRNRMCSLRKRVHTYIHTNIHINTLAPTGRPSSPPHTYIHTYIQNARQARMYGCVNVYGCMCMCDVCHNTAPQ